MLTVWKRLKSFLMKKIENVVKDKLPDLADAAVEKAESLIREGNGVAKKKIAVDYVFNLLPLPGKLKILRPVIAPILEKIIDIAVEKAVDRLHLLQEQVHKGED